MTDKMREEFEAAYVEGLVCRCGEGFRSTAVYSLTEKRPDGEYLHYPDFIAWWGWQASREAMVVELPPAPEVPEDPEEAIDDSHMDAYHSAIGMRHACSKFIEAAGVKVKP